MSAHIKTLVSLESGDYLTREEFHRRYLERPDINRAELVEGIVYIGSRVRVLEHGEPHATLVGWLGTYAARVPGMDVSAQGTVFLDSRNEVQPDAFLLCEGRDRL